MPEYRKIEVTGIDSEVSFYGNAGALAEFQDLTGLGASETLKAVAELNYGVIYALMYQAYRVSMLRQKKTLDLSIQDFKLNISGVKFIEMCTLVLSDIFEDCGLKEVEKKTKQQAKK